MTVNLVQALIFLAVIMVLEFVVMVFVFAIKYPYAGNVVIDIRRTADEFTSLSISSHLRTLITGKSTKH